MRILFVHEVNYQNKVIFEMHEFPELLALRGHDVSFFHYPESPDKPRASLRTHREVITGRVHPSATLTLVTPPTFGGQAAERYVAPFLDCSSLQREIRQGHYDVIVLYAVPTTGWQTIAAARRAGVPVLFRALDVSHLIRRNVLSGLIKVAERYIYRHATLVSGNNPALVDYCVALSGRMGPSQVNLPPIDLSHFDGRAGADVRSKLGISATDKVLVYMGSFFEFSGLDVVVKGMVGELAEHPDLRLVLIGSGALDSTLRRLVTELGLADRVIFTGQIPYDDLPDYLKIGDVAINPFMPELLTHVALPHKVLQYMAAGVPVVSTSLDGLRGVLGDASGVTWVPDPHAVVKAATDLAYREPAELAGISANQRSYVASKFSKEASVTSLESSLAALL